MQILFMNTIGISWSIFWSLIIKACIVWDQCIYVDESLDRQFSFIQSLLGIMINIITNVMLYVS